MSAITKAGERAAEAVRELNHLTLPGRAELEYPADAYIVIGDMLLMVQRLPQLLDQLTKWLTCEHEAGRVGVDSASLDAGLSVAMTRDALESAGAVAWNLERHLTWAHRSCAHLTGLDNNEEG